MRYVANLIRSLGDWLVGLSDRAKKQLVLGGLVLLLSGGIYKLIRSVNKLNQPLPAVSPEQLIQPMEELFQQTQDDVSKHQQSRKSAMTNLDSLVDVYSNKKSTPQ